MKLTALILRKIVRYEPKTGLFFRRSDGRRLGTKNAGGYIVVAIKRKLYYAHRLAFLYQTGKWPKHRVDHKEFQRSDNRWSKIRTATFSESNHYRVVHSSTGFRGATLIPSSGRYRSRISIKGKSMHLGVFDKPEKAHRAYMRAARAHYGKFAIARNS